MRATDPAGHQALSLSAVDSLAGLLPLALLRFGLDGKLLEVSDSFLTMFGYRRDEIVDLDRFWCSVGTDQAARNEFFRAMESGAAGVGPLPFDASCRDGERLPVELRCRFGSVIELVLLETGQRIAAIDLLLRREQTLIEVMNATFDGVGIHQNGIILFANKALADLWGLTVDELTGRNGYDFWREEDHPKLREIARNREQVSRVEVEALSASGEQIPCEVQGRPILFNGSKARLFTVRDLRSDRAGERHRHELEWLHLALGAADAGTWEWCDESGRQLWSTEARRLLGVDHLAGPADWTDSIDMRDLPLVLNQIDGAMWLGKPFHIEFRCHVGGKLRWVDMRGKRIERSGHSPCYLGVVSDVTARHLLEERLRNQQSLHRAIVENAVDAIEVVDPDSFRIVEFNDAACQLLGYQRNEYAQLTIADTQAEFSLKELRSRAASILVGERLVFDTRHRHKEGHLLDVHVRLRKVEIDGQQYLVVIWGDVTERKRSEEQMRILSQALEQNPHGIMVTDQTTRVTYVNQAFTTTTGFSADEIVGKSANWLGEEHTPQETLDDLARVVAQGREWRGEFHNQRKDGRIGIDLTHISPVRDEDGKISHFIGIQEDVTRQREIEAKLARYQQNLEQEVSRRTEALANAEARLGMVIESTPDGIIELDTDGRIVMANQAAVRLLARPMNELEGALMHGVVHHHHANGYRHQEEACPILSCLSASREVRVLEDVFWRPDGTSLPVSYAAHPMVEQGQTIGVVIVFSDNTLRQMAADAMRSAQESAERLALAKSEFLAHMSHEIRTPLNGVIGLAQIGYRESDGNRRLHGLFDKIIHSGRMLSIILNDILDFSRIEANKLQLEEAPFEPVMIARDAVDLVRPRLNSGVSLRAEVGDGIPAAVLGDQTRVSQIVLNLLSNAVKFTKSGEVVVALGCSDGRLTYRVSDSGIGIEPEAIERLFAPFEQGDSSTSRQYGGTGLGLAISQRLATMMGATLSVESRVGVGSHFTLHLPCRETAMPAPASAGHPSEESRHRLAGLRLLVAEDNEISRLVLEDMLTGEGAECLLVTNGAEAVATVENEPDRFDLLMIDVQMPVMDGRAATRRIRAIAPGLPIVGQTAHALAEEHAQCLDAGMVAVLTKPIELEVMVRTLLEWVGHKVVQSAKPQVDGANGVGMEDKGRSGMVDWERLSRYYSPGLIAQLARLTLDNLGDTADRLHAAVDNGSLSTIARIAHHVRGTAANLYVEPLGELAQKTEVVAKRGESEACVLAADLAEKVTELLSDLESYGDSEV